MRVSLCHLAPKRGDRPGNLAALAAAFEQAIDQGGELILFPELATAGYGFANLTEVSEHAEPADGATAQLMTKLCAQHQVHCLVGFLEATPSQEFHNAALLVGPQGVIGHQHKLVRAESWGDPATKLPNNYQTPWGKLGVLICADSYYSDPAAQLVVSGADALLVIAAWPVIGIDPRDIWRARSRWLEVPIIACNRTGNADGFDSLNATSAIYDANGFQLAQIQSDRPTVQTFEIAIDQRKPVPAVEFDFPAELADKQSQPTKISLDCGQADYSQPSYLIDTGWAEARLAYRSAMQPGVLARLAHRGFDLVRISAPKLAQQDLEMLLMGCLDRIAVAVITPDRVGLGIPPLGMDPVTIIIDSHIEAELTGAYTPKTGSEGWLPALLER